MSGPIVLAAGGTGGHIFPAEALARALLARGERVVLVTDTRGGAFDALPEVETHRVHAASPGGRSLWGQLRAGFQMSLGANQARRLLKRLRAAAVVGFGGYPSAPTGFAATRHGFPMIVHEQNAVLGRVNRWLLPRVRAVAVAFDRVAGVDPADPRVEVTGNPVRPAIAAMAGAPYDVPEEAGPLRLLVLGGSQGARVFSELVPAALALLPEPMRRRLAVVQQCRPEDLDECRTRYAAIGIAAELSTFFRDVPERLAAAQLVVCRSGASTVCELTTVGRPAILVPYPHATDDHQTANAKALEEKGAAWVMPQDGLSAEVLATRLLALYARPAELAEAARAARAAARLDAADRLADLVLRVAGRGAAVGSPSPAHQEAAR